MFNRRGTEVVVVREISAIVIPDGIEANIHEGETVFIQQVLGGMFTVQTDRGYLMRVDGKDAEALGQPIPDERRMVTEEEVKEKGLKACVMEQLKTCYDPEIPVNIVDLGLIYECEVKKIDDGQELVRIEMTLTAPGCGMGEILKSDVEKKVRDIPGVKALIVDLVFDPPWESSLMSEAAKLQLGFL
ncbi:MAG TPA: putative Fe-S cluster assembly protein SufT [Myxococcota bacterium]|nr:putative Fe-S cluster assembly protein SufT [Myxococcota bacterium]